MLFAWTLFDAELHTQDVGMFAIKRSVGLGRFQTKYIHTRRYVSYEQGQSPEPKIREYFYYIDHEGMLYLDDARMKNFTSCFKERKFLKFFFSRIKFNDSGRYTAEFPWLSLCGRERNFIRCDDLPIVYTHLLPPNTEDGKAKLSYARAGDDLVVDFQPEKLYMEPMTGRVYHPAWQTVGGIGLVRSKLAIELSNDFEFVAPESATQLPSPTHFKWRGDRLKLEVDWVQDCRRHLKC